MKAFEQARHPRYPKGHARGGQFRPSGVVAVRAPTATAESEPPPPDLTELHEIMEATLGWREYQEQPDDATALRATLHYLGRDGDLWMIEYLLHHYDWLLDEGGEAAELRAELATVGGEAGPDVLAVPDLPAWATPRRGAATGAGLLDAALDAGMPVTDEPVTFSTWLLENGQYLNMVDAQGRPTHHDDVSELFGPHAPADGRHQARFALRTGALRVFLPALEMDAGGDIGQAFILRLDAGQPVTEAQATALRRLLAQADLAQIERRVLGRERSADRAWDVRVGGTWEDQRRAAGFGLRVLGADCRDPATGRVSAPPAPGPGNRPLTVETPGLRKALLVFGRGIGRARRSDREGLSLQVADASVTPWS